MYLNDHFTKERFVRKYSLKRRHYLNWSSHIVAIGEPIQLIPSLI